MENINEVIIPNIPQLAFTVKSLNCDSAKASLRGRHFHKEFEIFRIDEGEMLFCTDNTKLKATAGEFVFINSFLIHEVKILSDKCQATYFQVDLQPYINSLFDIEDNFLYHFIQIQESEKIKVFSTDKICDIINMLEYELMHKQKYFDIQAKAYIYQLIVYLYRKNFILDYTRFNKKSILKIIPVIDYINENLDKKIYLDDVCSLLHIDKFYFCKLFKQTMGATLTEYVNFARMYKAKQLLIGYKTSVSEVSTVCGFSSIQYFNKLFKKQYGVSPTEYRNIFFNT